MKNNLNQRVILLFLLLIVLGSVDGIAQQQGFRLSVSIGSRFIKPTMGAVRNPLYAGLEQRGDWGNAWTIRTEVAYPLSKRLHLLSGLRFNTNHYIQYQRPYLRFSMDHDGNGSYAPRTFIKSSIRYQSIGVPLGLGMDLNPSLSIRSTLVVYGNSNSPVESHLEVDEQYANDLNLGEGQFNPIPNRAWSLEFGVFYQPRQLFSWESNPIFFGGTFEYYLTRDEVYFSNSRVLLVGTQLLLGARF